MNTTTIPANALEIYRMLPEGTRCEVLYNVLTMSPAPSIQHQLLSFKLSGLLFNFLEKRDIGIAVASPVDVYFEEDHTVVQPDILLVLHENNAIIHKNGIYGAPDIVIEILSGNRIHDVVNKKEIYGKAGVKEYFIIDPENKQVMLFANNGTGRFALVHEENASLTSAILKATLEF